MFNTWGGIVPRFRFLILAIVTAIMAGLGILGSTMGQPFGQGGFEDPNSEWAAAEEIENEAYGRDSLSDVVVMYHAPPGMEITDPAFLDPIQESLDSIREEHPDDVLGVFSYPESRSPALAEPDAGVVVASIQLHGEGEEVLQHYRAIEDDIPVEGIETEIAGLQPVAGALDQGMTDDLVRAELIALPVVFVLLVIIFGGLIAALLPVIVGVLTIVGSLGGLHLLTYLVPVNAFAENVVTLLGLGLAIDYGLLVVSRFREEIAEGYPPDVAVRRTVATAGRTVSFSALMVFVTLSGLLMFPQDFLRSIAIGAMAAVTLAAVISVTLLPAALAILGHRVDMFGIKRFQRHRSREEVERGAFGKIAAFSMRNPILLTVPIVLVLLALILPFTNVQFGGINETHLPPDEPTRVAQENYDELFPDQRTDPVKLVIRGHDSQSLSQIRNDANDAPGLTGPFDFARSGNTDDAGNPVVVLQAGLVDRDDAGETIEYLRSFPIPEDTEVLVSGNPAMELDSVDALIDGLPWFALYVFLMTTLLLFLAFGSLVLPFKAAVMNVLGLGATLGILTWIFVEGNGAEIANFTPGPLTSPVVVLLVAILYGLSADYEVFLVARMVEARGHGASTSEAIRKGVANTGRIITSAALILIVVTGAFAFSDIVMMKYIAFGMIAGLILDATVIRLFLVPAVMQLLGDDCWWAPQWMKRLQRRVGLGEEELPEEPELKAGDSGVYADRLRASREPVGAGVSSGAVAAGSVGAAGATGAGASSGNGFTGYEYLHEPGQLDEADYDDNGFDENVYEESAYGVGDFDDGIVDHDDVHHGDRDADELSFEEFTYSRPTSDTFSDDAPRFDAREVESGEAPVEPESKPRRGRHVTDDGRESAAELIARLRAERGESPER